MTIRSDLFDGVRDCRAHYLQRLAALLRDTGLLSNSAISAIQEGAGAYFDEMVATERRTSFADEARGLTSSRITLVGEDELELGIRLDRLANALFDAVGATLWKIHLRLMTLLRRPGMAATDNPVGPLGISQGLQAMFAAAGAGTLDQKLDLLDRIEACLRQSLPGLYTEIEAYLAGKGVEAAQASIVSSPEAAPPARRSAAAPDPANGGLSGNALEALQQALVDRLPANALNPSGAGAVGGVLNQAMLERLTFRLDDLERRGVFAAAPAAGTLMPELFPSAAAGPSAPRSLRASELGVPPEAKEGIAIDTLAMIFEAIFNDPELPDTLKALISSLQITVLKVAMTDRSLFTDERHIVRRVLDGMARAVAGLPIDVAAKHPVCARLTAIAAALRGDGGDKGKRFEAALAELEKLRQQRTGELARFAQPYLPLLERLDRRDLAARAVRETVADLLAGEPAGPLRRLVATTWRDHLQRIGEAEGTDSPAWQEAVAVIRDLRWTFEPKGDAEGRKALADRLPAILTRLKADMAAANVPTETQEQLLDECFKLQTLALRNQPRPQTPPGNEELLPAEALEADDNAVLAGTLEGGGLRLATLDPGPRPAAFGNALPCNAGDWLEMQGTDGRKLILHVCHISPLSRRLLLGNPESGFVMAAHPAIVDRQFREGKARNLSLDSLFDRSAARALGNGGKR